MNAKPRLIHAAAVTLAILAGSALPATAQTSQPTQDRERLIDVGALEEAMTRATTPLAERVEASRLKEAFEGVNELLRADSVDKAQLIAALKSLRDEIQTFTADWDDSVAAPMWTAQDQVGSTIARVRSLLAKGDPDSVDDRTSRMLDGYDRRLEQLAVSIQNETDEVRRDRLRLIFANTRSLRDVVQATGSFNLGSAREAVYVKTIRALAALEAQLTNAMFEIERVRLVLSAEGEFIADYVELLEGLVEAETLARMLSATAADGSSGISSLVNQMGELSLRTDELGSNVDLFVEELTDSIELQAEELADRVELQRFGNIDVDDEVAEYAARAKARQQAQQNQNPTGTRANRPGGNR
ncbi:MAG: hypothetical protein AAGI17_07160 [Planctomycetota bacterium]